MIFRLNLPENAKSTQITQLLMEYFRALKL